MASVVNGIDTDADVKYDIDVALDIDIDVDIDVESKMIISNVSLKDA